MVPSLLFQQDCCDTDTVLLLTADVAIVVGTLHENKSTKAQAQTETCTGRVTVFFGGNGPFASE